MPPAHRGGAALVRRRGPGEPSRATARAILGAGARRPRVRPVRLSTSSPFDPAGRDAGLNEEQAKPAAIGPRISFLPGTGLRFARHQPDPALAEHVECYWTVDVDRPPATVDLVPDGLVDVTFRYFTTDGEGEPAAFVTGPTTEHVRYRHDRVVHLLGVGLRPGSALALLGVPVAALAPQ